MAHVTHKLAGYLDGALPEAERERMDRHLAACPRCRAALADLHAAGRALREAARAVPPPVVDGALWARVRAEIGPGTPPATEQRPALTSAAPAMMYAAAPPAAAAPHERLDAPAPRRRPAPRWAFAGGLAFAAVALIAVMLARPGVSPVAPASKPDMVAKVPTVAPPRPPAAEPNLRSAWEAGTPGQAEPAPSERPRPQPSPMLAPGPADAGLMRPRQAEPPRSPVLTPAPATLGTAAPRGATGGGFGAGSGLGAGTPSGTLDEASAPDRADQARRLAQAPAPAAAAPHAKMAPAPPPAPPATPAEAKPRTMAARELPDAGAAAPRPPVASGIHLFAAARGARAMGDTVKARTDYEAALQAGLAPTEARLAHLALAGIAEQQGDDRAAAAHYAAAMELAGDAPNLVRLGAVYERLHERAKAEDAYRAALRLAPDNAAAKAGLERVKPH